MSENMVIVLLIRKEKKKLTFACRNISIGVIIIKDSAHVPCFLKEYHVFPFRTYFPRILNLLLRLLMCLLKLTQEVVLNYLLGFQVLISLKGRYVSTLAR